MPAPVTLILDTVVGFGVDYSPNEPSTWIRPGIVFNLSGDPKTILDQCISAPGMPPLGDSITQGGKTLYFRRLQIEVPPSGDSTTVALKLVYDNTLNGPNSAYTISVRGYEQSYSTNRIPGTRTPILIPKWVQTPGALFSPTIPADLAVVTFAYPMREVTISGIKQGATPPPGAYDGYVGFVNSTSWLGRNAGFFKINSGGSTSSVYSGMYSYSMSAVTKNIEDWSTYHILHSNKFGIYATVADADDAAMHAEAYKHGIIKGVPGCVRVGPFPTVDFGPLFGSILAGPTYFGYSF